MKTREIRDRIGAMGYEQGVVYCLEAINEEMLQTRRDIRELAVYFDKLTESMNGMLIVAGNMREVLDKQSMSEEDLGPNTHSLDKL